MEVRDVLFLSLFAVLMVLFIWYARKKGYSLADITCALVVGGLGEPMAAEQCFSQKTKNIPKKTKTQRR